MRTDALSFMTFEDLRQREACADDRQDWRESDACRAEIDRRWCMMLTAIRHVNDRVCEAVGEADPDDVFLQSFAKGDMDAIEAACDERMYRAAEAARVEAQAAEAASRPDGWMRELSAERYDAMQKWMGRR